MKNLNPIVLVDKLLGKIALLLIRAYQLVLSPFMGNACRFSPTCSEYAKQVFTSHSAPVALYWTVRRVLRCHPFSPGGEDPPPEPKQKRVRCQ